MIPKCPECGLYYASYDYEDKTYTCTCGHVEKVIGKEKIHTCGHVYTYYTWFDPSYCPKCHWSFVD
jgi:hypothetical protein